MSKPRVGLMHSFVACMLIVGALAGMAGQASGQDDTRQQLKLPFGPGAVTITADETYGGDVEHPSSLAVAFDMVLPSGDPNPEVVAVGSGLVKIDCVHKSGAAILHLLVDGYGSFFYVHIDERTLPRWMKDSWTRVERGQVIGRLYPDRINSGRRDVCGQISTGPHLHLDFPRRGMTLDGVKFTNKFPNDGDVLNSTNAPPTGPSSATCGGFEATIIGTSGHDVILGTDGVDVIAGMQGHDTIAGVEGDDILCGGEGDDHIFGGFGFDVIYGGQGGDVIFGSNGTQPADRADTAGGRYYGGKGHDWIFGTNRWDRMQGGAGRDLLFGFAGRDWMRGGSEADRLDGGGSIDDMNGGKGNDDILAGTDDLVSGGAGDRDECNTSNGTPERILSCELSF